MNIFDFMSEYVMGNEFEYFFIFISVSFIHYFVFKRHIKILMDPFVVLLFHIVAYSSTVIFMQWNDLIDEKFLIHYIITNIVFILSLNWFSPIKHEKIFVARLSNSCFDEKIILTAYKISAIAYILCKMYIAFKVGFPIFTPEISRLVIYQPVAVYQRIADVFFATSICCICYKFVEKNVRVFDKILLIFMFLNMFLSGGKSSFFVPISYVVVYSFFDKELFLRIIKLQWFIVFGILTAFISILLLLQGNDELLFEKIMFVIVGRADAYVAFYTSDYSEIMSYFDQYGGIFNFISHAFFNWIAVFKLVPYDELPISYANLMNIHTFGGVTDEMGMVATYNLFPFAYMGWIGSIVFSFFVGLVFSFVRNKLIYYCAGSILLRFFYVITFCSIGTFVISMPVFWDQYILNIVGYVFILLLAYIINCMMYRRINEKS